MLRRRPAFLLIEQTVALGLLIVGVFILTTSLSQFKAHQVCRRTNTAEQAVIAMTANRLVHHLPDQTQWQLHRQTYQVAIKNQTINVTSETGEQVAVKWHCY
ncbi:hypothetical protein [Latilactobacillus graminis]|uniref:Uncharacterized protein n=2 Tax=Latilactobacillus graminis TaxID=60519 RepID=A0AA89I459_9LACO|nr:hypothetical protein [Latilactobacillus graminis]KRM21216.1 hypothetical protein FC90_GL001753 [Latilactobacillus graminis DSM 20719]QFP79342.1 hypothetical protein LG542_03455 [Latilactobacillus graminis]